MTKFGEKFTEPWPNQNAQNLLTDFGKKLLSDCLEIEKKNFDETTVEDIIKVSSKFPLKFPTNNCRIQSQPINRYPMIREQLASAYPVIHERVLFLYLKFLEHKAEYGTYIEKQVFSNMTLTEFVHRLLANRCAAFFGSKDRYRLISGENGYDGFTTVGTEEEIPPLVLKNVLSYDEIKLSALLSVSSHSEFLNDGNRNNCGVIETDKSKIEREGVVVGLIGARMCRPGLMEFQDIIISKTQNTIENGYGQNSTSTQTKKSNLREVWKSFYEEDDFLYQQVTKNGKRFGDSSKKDDIFDNLIMKKRFAISFDTLLLESESRAVAAGKRAYIHVVGIGLGVWEVASQQEEIFLLTFAERLKMLLPKLNHVAVVHFSWFKMKKCGDLKDGGIFKSKQHPDGGIQTFLSNRNPADKLNQPDLLTIESYAWDGNALPGNEFWTGYLKGSGDPAAACSTLITEIHNPHINSKMVCGENLHIASPEFGVIHISEYSKKVLKL